MSDFNYIFDIAHVFGFTKIRCSYVSPASMNININKFDYYQNGKNLFLKFIETA